MFRKTIAVIACGLVLVPSLAQAQTATAGKVVVHKGVVLRLTNIQPLDSTKAKHGDQVPLKLTRPLVIEGITVLPEGEVVYGKITRVKHAGKDCRDGRVKLKVENITFPDSSQARTHILFAKEGQNVEVPDVEPGTDKRLSAGDIMDGAGTVFEGLMWFIVLAPVLVIALPSILDDNAAAKAKACGGKMGQEYLLPENSTVAVAIARDHAVTH